ncbi:MAG: alpha/beta hydrolase [Candidatus Thorarchaeota archaeon]
MFVHTERAGSTSLRPVVLVHGAGGSSATWFMQLRGLRQAAHVVAIDLNGHGSTPDRNEPDVTQSYIDDVDKVVGEFDRPVLVGHSMGGAIAQLYALSYPRKIGGLILVGTGARLRVNPLIFDLLDRDFDSYVTSMASYVFAEGADTEMVEASIAEMRKCPSSVVKRDFEVCNRFDIMDRVQEIVVPTLIVVGDKDVMTPVKYSTFLRDRIRDSKLAVISDAGHMVMLERHREFNSAVAGWLNEL